MSDIEHAPARDLATLETEIREEVEAAERSWSDAVGHAIRAGELLIEAKAKVEHGQWLPWLREKFPGSERTAQNYMRLASNPQRVAGLPTVRNALSILAEPSNVAVKVTCPGCKRIVRPDDFNKGVPKSAAVPGQCSTCGTVTGPPELPVIDSERKRQVAEKAKERLWGVVVKRGSVGDHSPAELVKLMKIEPGVAITSQADLRAMVSDLDKGMAFSRELRHQLASYLTEERPR